MGLQPTLLGDHPSQAASRTPPTSCPLRRLLWLLWDSFTQPCLMAGWPRGATQPNAGAPGVPRTAPSQPRSLLATKPSSFHLPSSFYLTASSLRLGRACILPCVLALRPGGPTRLCCTNKQAPFQSLWYHHCHPRQPQHGHSPTTGPSIQGGEVPSGTQRFHGRNRSEARGGKTQCLWDGPVVGPQVSDAPPSTRGV